MASLINRIKKKESNSLISKIKGDKVGVGTSGAISPTTFEVERTRPVVSVDLSDPNIKEEGLKNLAEFEAKQEDRRQTTSQDRRKSFVNEFGKLEIPKSVSELISKPLTAVPRAIEGIVGAKPDVSSGIQGAVTGAVRQTPIVGRGVVSTEELQKAREEAPVLGTFKENVPLVGGRDLTPVDIGSAAASLGFTASQYSQINKILGGLGTASKLGKALGSSKLAKFGATQAVDLLADTIIQTPGEVFDAIEQDKSLGQASIDFLKNRGVDVLVNAVIGGAIELPNLIKGLKQVDPATAKQVIDKLPEGQTKTTLQQQLSSEAFLKSDGGKAFADAQTRLPEFDPTRRAIAPSQQAVSKTVDNPIVNKIKGVEPGTARQAEIQQPEVGTSKSSFLERLKGSPSEKLRNQIKSIDLSTTSNEARTALAKEITSDNFDAAVQMVKTGDQFGSGLESEIGREVVNRLQSTGRSEEALEVIQNMAKKFRRSGQDVQAASMWAMTSPEGVQKWATNTLEKANVKVDPEVIANVGKRVESINQMTTEELAEQLSKQFEGKIQRQAFDKLIADESYDSLKNMNMQVTLQGIRNKLPTAANRKLSSVQAISHLLNFKTFNRNILGNTAMQVADNIAKVPSSIMDRALSLGTGNRTVMAKLPRFQDGFKEGLEGSKKSLSEIFLGINRVSQDKYDLFMESAFKSKFGKGVEKVLSTSLQTPDEFFKGFANADAIYNQVRARIGNSADKMTFGELLETATKEEIQAATDYAKYVTFQDDTYPAKMLSELKKLLNRVGLPGSTKKLGDVQDFGLGDLIVKYTRVPGNIISRGVEFSPAGYLKMFDILKGVNDPKKQREIALAFGRATTGTSLMLLGSKLQNEGIITGGGNEKDYDLQSLLRSEGQGNFKINTSALGRMLTGQDHSPQEGDSLKSYNWAQPVSLPIMVGASVSEEKTDEKRDFKELATDFSKGTFEQMLDLPMLYTIKSMFYESMGGDSTAYDVMSVPVEQSLSGFVPSIIRQTAQTIDPTIRDTKGENEVINKIKANIPLLSKTLPPKLDPLGREQQRSTGILPNLIDPAISTTFKPTGLTEDLERIANATGKDSVFPERKAPNSFSFGGEKITLTPEEKQSWLKTQGKFIEQEYSNLLKSVNIDTIESQGQLISLAKALEKIKSAAREKAKTELLQKRGN